MSHPIQYHAPLFRALATCPNLDFTALYCHDHGTRPTYDPGFGKTIQYDVPLLDGYRYRLLPNVSPDPSVAPTGQLNPEILAILLRQEFDAIISHGYASPTTLMALCAPRGRTRLLLRGDSNVRLSKPLFRRLVKQAVLRVLFGRVDHFLAVGALNREYYRSFGVGDDRITDAPFSVDNDFFSTRSAESRGDPVGARARLGLPDKGALFIAVGKLQQRKRPLDVLAAFSAIARGTEAGLAFVGDGEQREALELEVTRLDLDGRVRVLGFRNQSELPALYGAADVVILPSDNEPWGLALNEGMAAGLVPLVSDQVGAAPDLAPDPASVFPVGNVRVLASRMADLAQRPELLQRLRALSAQRIALHSISRTVTGILSGVEKALRSPGRRKIPGNS